MVPLNLGHCSSVEFPNLIVLASLAFVGPVSLSADDIGGRLIWWRPVVLPDQTRPAAVHGQEFSP
jgi:hypothetical protein